MFKLTNMLPRFSIGKFLVISVPYTWLLVLFLVPFFIVFKISFAEQAIAIPPYTHLYTHDADMNSVVVTVNYFNYVDIFTDYWATLNAVLNPFASPEAKALGDNIYLLTYLSSLKVALVTTVVCFLLGYPVAYGIARAKPEYRNGLLLAIMLPFWTSFLIRIYAWMGLLSRTGLVNNTLMSMGWITEPLDMFYNEGSLFLVMVYVYLPFMVLPLYAQLVKMDVSLLEAANDLGAGPIRAFLSITLPLSKAGIIAGSMMVFIPSVGEFVVPELVAGPDNLMIGKVLWQAFFDQNNWPLASALAVVMVVLLVVPIALFHRYEARELTGESNA